MNIETLSEKVSFAKNCRTVARNKGHRFANAMAAEAYEAKVAFLESITSKIPERVQTVIELEQERKDIETALAMEKEQAARVTERLKFNEIISATKDIKGGD